MSWGQDSYDDGRMAAQLAENASRRQRLRPFLDHQVPTANGIVEIIPLTSSDLTAGWQVDSEPFPGIYLYESGWCCWNGIVDAVDPSYQNVTNIGVLPSEVCPYQMEPVTLFSTALNDLGSPFASLAAYVFPSGALHIDNAHYDGSAGVFQLADYLGGSPNPVGVTLNSVYYQTIGTALPNPL